jgi:hypothetical protein
MLCFPVKSFIKVRLHLFAMPRGKPIFPYVILLTIIALLVFPSVVVHHGYSQTAAGEISILSSS